MNGLKKKLLKIFKKLVEDPDYEWKFIDGSIVKAHQHSTGARKQERTAIGKSVAGNSTKIHLATDAFGLPVEIIVTEGQVHDSQVACDLISKLPVGGSVIADKGYDDSFIRCYIKARKGDPIIPKRKNAKIKQVDFDWGSYKNRHIVENTFARLKHFRSISTRYDKLKRNFEGMLLITFCYMWLPM